MYNKKSIAGQRAHFNMLDGMPARASAGSVNGRATLLPLPSGLPCVLCGSPLRGKSTPCP